MPRLHVFPVFHRLTKEDVKRAQTVRLKLSDGRVVEVDDVGNWFADDATVFGVVDPLFHDCPHRLKYSPLPRLRAWDIAKWMAEKLKGEVLDEKPVYPKEAYFVPPGADA